VPGRVAGILLHPTSLPGPFGIGELGPEAFAFLDFLAQTGQSIWQVLPLGPTGYGDSPYQCFSAFAGNPLLVSLAALRDDGLLRGADVEPAKLPPGRVDYGAVIERKLPLLARAQATFHEKAPPSARAALDAFRGEHATWLNDFALFMALKRAHGGAAWHTWDRPLVRREKAALGKARRELAREIRQVEFEQWLFFSQWDALRRESRARGIRIMGDVPIFVSHDSADVWARPEIFHLAEDGSPALQAGVPPDYFSETGQLWGNPLYRWEALAEEGYGWWIDRIRAVLTLVDLVRLDHFRGFEACWEVPGDDTTAVGGRWGRGPGASLFEAMRAALGPLPVVAENLGLITPEVEALRAQLGFPGMAVLQFAFGEDDPTNPFRPHNFSPRTFAYTATHDNDTVVGWWKSGVGDSTRSEEEVASEHSRALAYLGGNGATIHWDAMRALFVSVAETVIIPLQDVLGLGAETRMNLPGRPDGNWTWRYTAGDLTSELRQRLRALTEVSGRVPPRTGDERDPVVSPPPPR